ncbi:MAG: DUF2905 domain-containing protein [Longimicrobiales bacterium]
MSGDQIGPLMLLVGVALAVLGAVLWIGGLDWFGRLPGDIRYESGDTRVYIPLTSMILLSVALTAIAWIVRRLLGE